MGPLALAHRFRQAAPVAAAWMVNHRRLLRNLIWCRAVRRGIASTGAFHSQVMTAGDIYPVAGDGTAGFSGDGGSAASVELLRPASVAVDAAGNLLIAGTGKDRVRMITG